MKNTFFLAAATLFFTAAQAQDTASVTGAVATDTTKKLNAYGSYSTRDSIAAKYKLLPMPAQMTQEQIFPVLGTYQLNNPVNTTSMDQTTATTDQVTTADSAAVATTVTVTMDSASKGMVWIEGLPQGKIKAYLRKSPSTYRIIPQQTESGTSVPEGTLIFDSTTKVMNIALGTAYNEADPAAVFALSAGTTAEDNTAEVKVKTKNAKTKTKLQFYTANKVVAQQPGTTNSFETSLEQAQQAQQTGTGNQQQ